LHVPHRAVQLDAPRPPARFTRLSNGFSRKKANLRAAVALYFAYYNFVKFHKSIRMTPAMAAGVAEKPWTLAELLGAAQATPRPATLSVAKPLQCGTRVGIPYAWRLVPLRAAGFPPRQSVAGSRHRKLPNVSGKGR